MTIIATTTAAPLRPQAVTDGVDDVVAEAFTVFGEVQDLARLGLQVSVTIAPGSITAGLAVSREAIGLLPGLIQQLEHSGITRTSGSARIVGTMCQGNVRLRITVDSAAITVAELEALVAAVDPGSGLADGESTGRAA